MAAPPTIIAALDDTMQRASEALAAMDYLECEALCLRALAEARGANDWAYYARILMPLQESRRQRRMIAADGAVRLGTTTLRGTPNDCLESYGAGCIVVSRPHGSEDAKKLIELASQRRRFVEVLFADCECSDEAWTLATCRGPQVTCTVTAPPPGWRDRWLSQAAASQKPDLSEGPDRLANAPGAAWPTPADWFLDASERLGDAVLATVDFALRGSDQIAALEACLEAVTDHEILHQRLFDAAMAAARGE